MTVVLEILSGTIRRHIYRDNSSTDRETTRRHFMRQLVEIYVPDNYNW